MIAFVADVKVGADTPSNVHLLTRLLYRHWDEWRENVRHHVFVASLAGGDPRDLTPGDFDSPPTQQEDAAIAFTPDSKEIVFVSNREGDDKEAFTTNNDVWSVPVGGGTAKKLTPNPAADVQPVFTRDGKFMIVRAQRRPGFESDRWYLDVYDRASGQKRTVFETPDLSVERLHPVARRQDDLVHRDEQRHRQPVSRGARGRRAAARGSRAARSPPPQIGADFVVFSKSTLTSPAELFRMGRTVAARLRSGQARRHSPTRTNRWLKDVAFEAPQSLDRPWRRRHADPVLADQAAELRRVEEIPGRVPAPRRTAGGLGRRVVVPLEPVALGGAGLGVAAPNPRGSTGFGQKFVDDISQDWGGKVMIDFDAVFDAVAKLPYVDATRAGSRRRELRRLRGGLADHAHQPLQGGGEPRRRVQPRVDVARDRRALVHGVGVRRAAVERARRRSSSRSARRIDSPTI